MSDNCIGILEILKVSSEMEGIALDWTHSLDIYIILHSEKCIKFITVNPFYKITLSSKFEDILQMLAKQL